MTNDANPIVMVGFSKTEPAPDVSFWGKDTPVPLPDGSDLALYLDHLSTDVNATNQRRLDVANALRTGQNVYLVAGPEVGAFLGHRGLHDQVIPRVSQTPGFVAGYWLEPLDGTGISVTLWESEQAAREAAGLIHPASSPTTGVKVDRIETREVIGQA